jgi:SAM-dependent methyltransferase
MTDREDRLWVASMPEAYHRKLEQVVFRPFAVDLARRAARLGPRQILEIAAGTGVLTSELTKALPDSDVTATDLSLPMVEFGSTQVPRASWRQADALDLPFDDQRYDLVVCQFGVMFFPDKPAGFAEARRVLKPDGRLLFNTWGPIETHDFAAALSDALARVFPVDPPDFLGAIPHGYHDLAAIAADLASGGMSSVTLETVTLEGTAASAADVAVGFGTGSPLRSAIEARGSPDQVVAALAEDMERRLGPGPVTGRMTAHVIEAMPALARRS